MFDFNTRAHERELNLPPSPLRGGVGGGGPQTLCVRPTPLPDPPPQGGREKD
jgi:hypothetical protein